MRCRRGPSSILVFVMLMAAVVPSAAARGGDLVGPQVEPAPPAEPHGRVPEHPTSTPGDAPALRVPESELKAIVPATGPLPRAAGERAPATVAARPAPGKADPASLNSLGMVRTAAALAAVIGLAMLVALITRKLAARRGGLAMSMGPAGRAPAGVVLVLARFPLQRGQLLVLMKVGPRILLLCQSRATRLGSPSLATLAEFSDPDEVAQIIELTREAQGESAAGRFHAVLERAGLAAAPAAGPAALRGTADRARRAGPVEPATDQPPARVLVGPGSDRVEISGSAQRMSAASPDQAPTRRATRVPGFASAAPAGGGGEPANAPVAHDGAELLRQRLARLRSGGNGARG